MTHPITRETVEARVAAIRNSFAGWRPDADLLLSLLARAETAERERDEARSERDDLNANLAHHMAHDRPKKLLADVAALTAERDRLAGELAETRDQLPEGMKNCTIVFNECEKGHGRLTATNWVDNGCPTCAKDFVRDEFDKTLEDVRETHLGELSIRDGRVRALTADLAAARETIAEMAALLRRVEPHIDADLFEDLDQANKTEGM